MEELICAPSSRGKLSITITKAWLWPQAGKVTGTEADGHILNLKLGWQRGFETSKPSSGDVLPLATPLLSLPKQTQQLGNLVFKYQNLWERFSLEHDRTQKHNYK